MSVITFIKSKLFKKQHTTDELAFLQSALTALQNEAGIPFGQYVKNKHAWHNGANLWVGSKKPSLIKGHKWQYECRSDESQLPEGQGRMLQYGPVWLEGCDLEILEDKDMTPFLRNLFNPLIGRRPGLWVANGDPGHTRKLMYKGRPGSITCIYDYLGANGVFEYKQAHPEVPIIIRIIHHQNWMQDPVGSAKSMADLVISKWPDMKTLDPYVYFANELNLGYESGQPQIPALNTEDFYKECGAWITDIAAQIKNAIPEM